VLYKYTTNTLLRILDNGSYMQVLSDSRPGHFIPRFSMNPRLCKPHNKPERCAGDISPLPRTEPRFSGRTTQSIVHTLGLINPVVLHSVQSIHQAWSTRSYYTEYRPYTRPDQRGRNTQRIVHTLGLINPVVLQSIVHTPGLINPVVLHSV
jgi:hypothetical protein